MSWGKSGPARDDGDESPKDPGAHPWYGRARGQEWCRHCDHSAYNCACWPRDENGVQQRQGGR